MHSSSNNTMDKSLVMQSCHGMCVCGNLLSCVRPFATPWTVTLQAPLSIAFSRQEYWSGLLCPRPGDRPHPGMESTSLMSAALAERFLTTSAIWEASQGDTIEELK